MAKRKAARAQTRRTTRKHTRASRARKAARTSTTRTARKAAKSTKRTRGARRAVARKASARTAGRGTTAKRKGTARKAVRARSARAAAQPKKVPALNRARRTVQDEDIVPGPPSSLDLDRSASAVRTGRREMQEKRDELTQTGPALTGGDVDADWESAYSVGDEVPGGDNPTPDQDIVDDIGRAVGVEYEDNEELKGDSKITKRDRHRWELDPASSEDYNER